MKLALYVLLACIGLSSACAIATAPLAAIGQLDVSRYQGVWYEIAKYPNRFQAQCVRNTRAEYRKAEDGTLQVINQCIEANGQLKRAQGAARQVDDENSAQLKVRFAPAWLSFLPFVWGNYWVIDLDADYQLAAISEPTREYLWILARQPHVDSGDYKRLLERLRQLGFDLNKLERSPQE